MTKPYKCRVEYLESAGTQYIDTGFVPTSDNFQFEIKMFSQNTSAYLGYRSVNSGTATGDMRWFFNYDSGKVAIRYGDGAENSTLSFNTQTTHKFYFNGSSLYIDDVNYLTTTKKYATPVYKSFYLFSVNASGYYSTDIASFVGRIYYAKIWDNDVLVRDFIPVLDNSGRPAMYDQVSGQLFYNQGSGEFTYGRQIIPVEYLESTGTQYIDTSVEKGSVSIIRTVADLSFNDLSTINAAGWGQSLSGGCFGFKQNATYIYFNLTGTDENSTLGYTAGKRLKFDLDGVNGTFKIYDGESLAYTATRTSSTSTNNNVGILFGFKNTSGINAKAQTIYSYKMYKNNVLVRDFIPCIDENLTPFMFDLVNCTVYLNAGTGQFKVGPYKADNLSKKLLRKKLALMLATLKKKRKYYCEVEYIESTGTQYIDTGLDYFADFEVGIKLASNVTNKALGNGQLYCMQRVAANTPYWQFSSGQNNSWNSQVPITEFHIIKWKDDKIYSDNIFLNDKTKGLNSPNQMLLFGVDASHTYSNMIYFCKLWNPTTGILVRDLIPVLDWDMKPCMYDRVTEQLFYNVGTGNFTAGREIHPVEYLESTGTQYIDTGYKPIPATTKLEFMFTPTSVSGNSFLFGARPDTSAGSNTCTAYRSGALVRRDWAGVSTYFTLSLNTTDKFLYTAYNNTVSLNNETYTGTVIRSTTRSDYNFMLFTVNTGGTIDNRMLSAKLYYSKLWDNGTLVRDFIPAIDENGVGFMFDRISHTCFLNQGTGTFKYPVREVEYLESTQTGTDKNWISTGVITNTQTKWEVRVSYNNTTTGQLMGSGVSGSNRFNIGIESKKFRFGFATTWFDANSEVLTPDTNPHTWILDSETKTGTIDGYSATRSDLTFGSNTIPIDLFARANNSSGTSESGNTPICKIYYSKIWQTGMLVRDLIPVFKDGTVGMLDKVNNVFYQNAGTGTFTTGKIVEPEYE